MKMDQKYIVVFDLEWNGGWGGVKLNEILQIGAVKLERLGGPVVDTFRAVIKPAVHKALNYAAQCLALSTEEMAQGEPFADALARFLTWCGGDCLFAAWGPHDLKELQANSNFWNLNAALPQSVCDLQAAAVMVMGSKNNIALHTMAEYFELPDALDFHDALNDAFYAAVVGGMVMELRGEAAMPACRADLPHAAAAPQDLRPYVQSTGLKRCGFDQELAILNNRNIRRPHCPECEKMLMIACWFPMEKGYLTRVACPEHGHQYFWVTTSQTQKGSWCANVHTLKAGSAVRALYEGRDRAHVIICKGSGKRDMLPLK